MHSVSLSGARIKDDNLSISLILEHLSPLSFDGRVKPHELELTSSLDLAIVDTIKLFHSFNQTLFWFSLAEKDNAEHTLLFGTNIICGESVELRDDFSEPGFCGGRISGRATSGHEGL